MPFIEALAIEIGKDIAKRVIDSFSPRSHKAGTASPEAFIADHLRFVLRWASRIEFFGLSRAKNTDKDTVGLYLSIPRKFSGRHKLVKPLSELALLKANKNYLLLGGPGAGKTTTLKRLARKVLREVPVSGLDRSQFPLVIRLREVTPNRPLEWHLGLVFGFELPEEKIVNGATGHVQIFVPRATPDFLRHLLATLDASGALIFLDGLDEVPRTMRVATEEAITYLAEHLDHARIVVSCRSGDYNRQLRQFDALELAPLEADQVVKIAKRWTTDPDAFLALLAKQPFADLSSRPLFLCQLLVLYNQTQTIPDQPSEVMDRILRLSLEEWDSKHKGQPRRSRYASFDSSRKRDFLATLAFWLTYSLRDKRFTTSNLEEAYVAIHTRFNLPAGETELVAQELETHTGIFVDAGQSTFEFSHLSLQEYLTASYLIRQPISRAFGEYLVTNSAPFAIACALSSTPERWLARVLLNRYTLPVLREIDRKSLFARLLQERPAFETGEDLGFACLVLALTANPVDDYTIAFLKTGVIQRSMGLACPYFTAQREEGGYRVKVRNDVAIENELDVPRHIWVGGDVLKRLEIAGVLAGISFSGFESA